MTAKKVIKFYFGFMMLIVTATALSYNDSVKEYYASTLHGMNDFVEDLQHHNETRRENMIPDVKEDFLAQQDEVTNSASTKFRMVNENSNLINFDVVKNQDSYFSTPGGKGINVMSFDLRTYSSDLELDYLKLKVYGTGSENIGKVSLVEKIGEEKIIVAFGKRSGEYFVFEDIGFEMDKNQKKYLSLQVDFGSGVHSGERIRFDLEKEDDIGMKVDGSKYSVNQFYPIEGEYISIVNFRK